MKETLLALSTALIIALATAPFIVGWTGNNKFHWIEALYGKIITFVVMGVALANLFFTAGVDAQYAISLDATNDLIPRSGPMMEPANMLWLIGILFAYYIAMLVFKFAVFEEKKGDEKG